MKIYLKMHLQQQLKDLAWQANKQGRFWVMVKATAIKISRSSKTNSLAKDQPTIKEAAHQTNAT
jgi:hypothetical protein